MKANTVTKAKNRLLPLSMAGLSAIQMSDGLLTRAALAQFQYPASASELQSSEPTFEELDILSDPT